MNQKRSVRFLCLCVSLFSTQMAFSVETIETSEQEQVEPAKTRKILRLPPLVISATRSEQSSFDLPAAIDVLDRDHIHEGKPQVNLSEVLARAPGIVVQNRQNYAQDLQISSRGFGARTAFGVRGVRLITDGIPASNPDGQGQAATFNLSSAERIEVLRGPFSAIYGNSSGGVIQIFTADGPERPTVGGDLVFGSYDMSKVGLDFGGQTGALNYIFDVSRFDTNGYREHSAATRDHLNSKFEYAFDNNSKLTAVINVLDQPGTQDPLGLTRAQIQSDRRQATPVALQFNTRKDIEHAQAGLTYEHTLDTHNTYWILGYGGNRKITQFLAIPTGPQNAPTHAGGVIDFDRFFGGLGVRWTHKNRLADVPVKITLGVDYDISDEDRKGYQNFIGTTLGVVGALKRDEQDKVIAINEYLQTQWDFAPKWSVSAGLRHTRIKFRSDDNFVAPGNLDDSGDTSYRDTSPMAGVVYKFSPTINLYVNAGQGFETPTFNELFYKPDGTTGLNFDLKPMQSNNYEAGIKAYIDTDTRVNITLFQIDTENEIVVATSTGGRTTFKNAGETERKGLELAVESGWEGGFNAYFAYTYLNAEFTDNFTACVGIPCTGAGAVTVPAGNKIPGVPRNTLYGELSWRHAPSNFSTALEARWNDKVFVNDTNSEFAASYTVVNWRAGLEQKDGPWHFKEFVRVENILDKEYIGSVIVGDTNGRFYEPAPVRNYMIGWRASYQF